MATLTSRRLLPVLLLFALPLTISAQEQSVKPGINDSFRDPNVKDFIGKFEVESREVYLRRQEIVAACQIQPGQTVADIGAGTGLFTRMFSEVVGKDGRVFAVDISQKFLDHIRLASREAEQPNVTPLLCKADSTELPADAIDVAFICDTYHHFEFPAKTMASLYRALKPGGRMILVDFRRVEGKSTDWVLTHVRAGQDIFEAEVVKAGFQKVHEERELLKENYFVIFQKPGGVASRVDQRLGPGRGRGMGMGRGPGAEMRGDQDVFHYLLEHHLKIRRTVTRLERGVETLTESDDPAVAAKIQEHVASMHTRIKEGRGLRFWDELFVALFRNYAKIAMSTENTDKGVRVKETSDDPTVVLLIQAHAEVVSLFVKHGFDEAHKTHAVPATSTAPTKLEFPVLPTHGGVLRRPQAVQVRVQAPLNRDKSSAPSDRKSRYAWEPPNDVRLRGFPTRNGCRALEQAHDHDRSNGESSHGASRIDRHLFERLASGPPCILPIHLNCLSQGFAEI